MPAITNCSLKLDPSGEGFLYRGTLNLRDGTDFYDICQPIPFSMFFNSLDFNDTIEKNIPNILAKLAALADGRVEKRVSPKEVIPINIPVRNESA